jgi:glutamate/aspartate transport system substrate-binding protein
MKTFFKLAILMAMTCSATAHASDTLQKIKDSGIVKLGVRPDTGALSYAISDGKYGGFHVAVCLAAVADLEKQLAKKLTVEFIPVTSQGRIHSVMSGAVDMECGVTTNNAARQKDVAFAVTTYVEEVRVVVRADSGITSIS